MTDENTPDPEVEFADMLNRALGVFDRQHPDAPITVDLSQGAEKARTSALEKLGYSGQRLTGLAELMKGETAEEITAEAQKMVRLFGPPDAPVSGPSWSLPPEQRNDNGRSEFEAILARQLGY